MNIFQKGGNVRLQTFGQLPLRRAGQRGNVPPQLYIYGLCFFISPLKGGNILLRATRQVFRQGPEKLSPEYS